MNLLERARCESPYLRGSSAERLIDELSAEVERLRAQKATLICDGCRQLGEVVTDNDRLRAVLEQAVDDFGEGHCVCEQTKQECIAALEHKP